MTFSRLKRRKAPKMGVRERPQIRSDAFQQFVRGYPCIIADKPGHVCSHKVQFCHVRKGNDGGLQVKPSDCFGVPICSNGHIPDQHQHGEATFERKYGVNLNAIAADLWGQWLSKTEAGRKYRRDDEAKRSNR